MARNVSEAKIINFKGYGEEEGRLVVFESNKEIPFDIARVFYIYGANDDVVRGQHANSESEFVLISVSGSCKVSVCDANNRKRVFELNTPECGLYIPNMLWKDMYDFSDDAVLLILASTSYNSREYIRDFEEFRCMTK